MRHVKRNAVRAAALVFLALFFFLCGQIGIQLHETFSVTAGARQLAAIRDDSAAIPGSDAVQPDGLVQINPDYAGWLTVDGTQADLPVVLGTDNTWYLDHDFYGATSRHGTLFLDRQTDLALDGNLLIYGHNMKDGTMFGELDEYRSQEFLAANDLIRWEAGGRAAYYRIFAVAVVPGDSGDASYLDLTVWCNQISDTDAEDMLDTLHQRAALWREVRHSPGDRYMLLVTCEYTRTNGRLLVAAQRLPESLAEEYEQQRQAAK